MRWSRAIALLTIMSFVSACTSYHAVAIRESPSGGVEPYPAIIPGDRVRLTMNNGDVHRFRVTVIEPGRLSGNGESHALENVAQIEVLRAEQEQTAVILVIAIIGVIAAVALLGEIEDGLECVFQAGCD